MKVPSTPVLILLFVNQLTQSEYLSLEKLASCLENANTTFLQRGTEEYTAVNYQWNTVNYVEPLGYILPTKTTHVQTAVRCTRHLQIPIAIKSGGHSFEKYCFGNNSSVVIDLRNLRSIKVNAQASTVLVGPGVLTGELFYKIWTQGKFLTPGPISASVGVGGAVLGGGYGWLSTKLGYMSDSTLEMKMVTANGSVLKVTATKHPDLFWALRGGGGGNFGIVTKYKLRMLNGSDTVYTLISMKFDFNQFVQVFKTFQAFAFNPLTPTMFIAVDLESDGITVQAVDINITYLELSYFMKKFPTPRRTPVIKSSCSFLRMLLANRHSGNVFKPSDLKDRKKLIPTKEFVKCKSYFVSKSISDGNISAVLNVVRRIPRKTLAGLLSVGGAMNQVPKDATAFVHRDSVYQIEVKIRSGNQESVQWTSDLEEVMLLLDNGESYQNIMDRTIPDYLKRYYGTNLERSKVVKEKYDPTNYFNFPQSIPLP